MRKKIIVAAMVAVMLTQAAVLSTTSAFAKVNPPVIQNSGIEDEQTTIAKLSSLTISYGDSAVVTASADDDEDGSTYAVYYKRSEDSGWLTVQTFDTNDLIYVKPKRIGSYDICVKAKNASGKLIRREVLNLTVVKDFAVDAELSDEQISLGGNVTVSAQAEGGVGLRQYAFFYKAVGDEKWTLKQSYSDNNEVQITPKRQGDYQICVKSKDEAGNIVKKYLDLAVADDLTVSTDYESDQIVLGESIMLTANASGGSGEYMYTACYRKQGDSAWTTIRGYGEGGLFEFKPSKGVTYDACVKVKDSYGRVKKDYTTFTVIDDMTVAYELSSDSVQAGENIVITASSQGGSGEHTYAFYYVKKSVYEADSEIAWECASHFEDGINTVTISPEVGEYYVCVKAKDKNGVVRKTEYGSFTVTSSVNISVSANFPYTRQAYHDTPALVRVSAQDGSGGYQYKAEYRIQGSEGEWVLARDFSTDAEIRLMDIKGADVYSMKTFDLRITAKDDQGNIGVCETYFLATALDEYESIPVK